MRYNQSIEAYEIKGNFHQDEKMSYFLKEKMLMICNINESSFAKEDLPYKALVLSWLVIIFPKQTIISHRAEHYFWTFSFSKIDQY